ncbi:methylmalonyl Co-A mutase-associated GTPase MeaB [Granulosicoccaceae sp. 1_MG-2023]|nr:methylmalonyl Co-A mutase-associated GTPase MeaB [Granulosicoccaceae sp. 1_MG-2023]
MPERPIVKRRRLTVDDYVSGVLSGQRGALARAITLIESSNPQHEAMAQEVLRQLLPHSGGSMRLGISGVPGVGKSTFIEAFGTGLCDQGHKVAVLAVDPSSSRTGGSILGDKTRMSELGVNENAFIRPSPTAGTLGGVARRTRETMLLCEAAGYDLIIVETVGVGQSETTVANMVDFFLVLMLPGAGDELQGIKKGILEIADMIVVNKADGPNANKARIAVQEYTRALRIVTPRSENWAPPVAYCSALEKAGLDNIWSLIGQFRSKLQESGEFDERRQRQQLDWMWAIIEQELISRMRNDPKVRAELADTEQAVADGRLPVRSAASKLLGIFRTE